MLTVFVAETGVRLPLRSLSSVDGLNGLKQEIQTLSSIPISSQILLTDKGGQVKAELLSQALLDDGSEDLVVYVFNRLALNQASQSVLNGSMVEIEPPVPLEVLRLVSPFNERNGVSLQEQCSAYAYAFQSHTSFAVANWKTAQNHLQSCERLVQEQRVQAEALRIAVTNLQVHSKSVCDAFDAYNGFAQKEFLKHAALLHSFPSDLQALHRIPVHPIIAKEEHRFLSDYVPEEKLMTWAESCKAAHDQLVKKTAVVAEQVRHIKTGTESELRHSLQIDFDKMDQQIRGVRDLLSQMGDRRRLIERDNGRVEATFRDSNNAIAMETISALHHLYEIHRNEYLQEIIHFDSVIRDQLTDIASSKLHLSYSLASRLQTISQLQSVIAAVSPQLSSLTSSLSSHEQAFAQLLHVHRMPPAWAACLVECVRRKEYVRFFLNKARDVAEVLAKFRRQEEKRRDNFKGEIVRYLPAKLVTGLDDKVPSWEIQVSNTKDNLPNITRNDLAEFEKLVNHLRAAMNDVDPSSSGLRGSQSSGGVHHNDSISKLQATLLKTLPQIDSLSSEFERILLKSGLSERASKLEEEVLKLRGHLSERSGGNLGSSPGTGDRGSISPSPTTTKRHLGGKAISAGTFDLRSVDPLELSRAEETIKAYEGRIKTLEGLLQRSYLQMSASRSTERTVTSDSPNISSPAVALPKPDAVKSAETVISTLTNENQSLQSKLESAESELTRLKLSMATLDSRHNLVLADRDRERAVGDAERHQLRLRCANLERELKESKNSITLREADLKALQSELERVAIFLREVHAQLDSCSLAMDTLAGRSTSLSNTIGRGPSPSIGIPLPTSRLTQTTGFSNSAPDGTPPLFNALSPRSPTMTSPIAITGSIGSGNTGISSSPTYPVLPSTVPSALILSLRSDEKEIRRRLRELEDDVRCQTLQLVGLQEEAGLGLHGEEVQEEDDEEDDEHVSQATSSADLELRSMGLSADAAAVPRLPTEPKLEEPTINALKEELLVAQSKVESLNMTVEKLHHFIENSEKTAAAAKTDYNAALSQIANLTENTDRVRLENSELLKKLKDMTGERVASDANNAAIMERVSMELVNANESLEATRKELNEIRQTSLEREENLLRSIEEAKFEYKKLLDINVELGKSQQNLQEALERTQRNLESTEVKLATAQGVASSAAERVEDWQLICKMAMEHLTLRHEALMGVAGAISDAVAELAISIPKADGGHTDSLESLASSQQSDKDIALPQGDAKQEASRYEAHALLLPPLKPMSLNQERSNRLSETIDTLSLGNSDSDSILPSRGGSLLRSNSAVDSTDALKDIYSSVIASVDIDLGDWTSRATSVLNLLKSKIRELNVALLAATKLSSHKISFQNFSVGDLALFLPTRNPKAWAAFNVNSPHHFLSLGSGQRLFATQMKNRDWILGVITSIETRRAGFATLDDVPKGGSSSETSGVGTQQPNDGVDDSSNPPRDLNPYGLAVGTKFYWCDAVQWVAPLSTSGK